MNPNIIKVRLLPSTLGLSELIASGRFISVSQSIDLSTFLEEDGDPDGIYLLSFDAQLKAWQIADFIEQSALRRPSLKTAFRFATQYPEMQRVKPTLCLPKGVIATDGSSIGVGVYGYAHTPKRFVETVMLSGFFGHYQTLAIH